MPNHKQQHPLQGLISKEEVLDLIFQGIKEGAIYGAKMAAQLAKQRYLERTGEAPIDAEYEEVHEEPRRGASGQRYPNDPEWKY